MAVGGRIGPQLERHGHDLAAGALFEQCRSGAVHPAAHRDQDATGPWVQQRLRALGDQRRQRPVERVRGQVGGMELSRRQPAQLGGDRSRR